MNSSPNAASLIHVFYEPPPTLYSIERSNPVFKAHRPVAVENPAAYTRMEMLYQNYTGQPVTVADRRGLTTRIPTQLCAGRSDFVIILRYTFFGDCSKSLMEQIAHVDHDSSLEMKQIKKELQDLPRGQQKAISVDVTYVIETKDLSAPCYHTTTDLLLTRASCGKSPAHPYSSRYVDASSLTNSNLIMATPDQAVFVRYHSKTKKTRYINLFGRTLRLIPNPQVAAPPEKKDESSDGGIYIYYPKRNAVGSPLPDDNVAWTYYTLEEARKTFHIFESIHDAQQGGTEIEMAAKAEAERQRVHEEAVRELKRSTEELKSYNSAQDQLYRERDAEREEYLARIRRLETERDDQRRRQQEEEKRQAEIEALRLKQQREHYEHQSKMEEMRRKDKSDSIKFFATLVVAGITLVTAIIKLVPSGGKT